MKYQQIHSGTLIKRYKRFLADVRLDNGQVITAHTTNTGSMLGCCTPGSKVSLSYHNSPTRKLKYTWEMIDVNGTWVGVNTHLPNAIVAEAIAQGKIQQLTGYDSLQREVAYGKNSRIDILLQKGKQLCYVEVKNTTIGQDGIAMFPDAVTERGRKHLLELALMVKQGHRGVIVFFVNRSDCKEFRAASHIDPEYAKTLALVHKQGVEILPLLAHVTPEKVEIVKTIPFVL